MRSVNVHVRIHSLLCVTYNVSDVMVDILKEAVALGEGGATVLDEIERPQLPERGEKLLNLRQGKCYNVHYINAWKIHVHVCIKLFGGWALIGEITT